MSSSRDYRSDPPSHQRLAARQAAQRSRSPEYMTNQRNYPQSSQQYGAEDYSQTRRVFTSDRDHRQHNTRDYNNMNYYSPQMEGRRSPNYYHEQHTPSQHSNIQSKYVRRHSPSPNHSQSFRMRQDNKWHADYRNRRSPPRSDLAPPDPPRPSPSTYKREQYLPPREKGRPTHQHPRERSPPAPPNKRRKENTDSRYSPSKTGTKSNRSPSGGSTSRSYNLSSTARSSKVSPRKSPLNLQSEGNYQDANRQSRNREGGEKVEHHDYEHNRIKMGNERSKEGNEWNRSYQRELSGENRMKGKSRSSDSYHSYQHPNVYNNDDQKVTSKRSSNYVEAGERKKRRSSSPRDKKEENYRQPQDNRKRSRSREKKLGRRIEQEHKSILKEKADEAGYQRGDYDFKRKSPRERSKSPHIHPEKRGNYSREQGDQHGIKENEHHSSSKERTRHGNGGDSSHRAKR